jgi:hypothetical protein
MKRILELAALAAVGLSSIPACSQESVKQDAHVVGYAYSVTQVRK